MGEERRLGPAEAVNTENGFAPPGGEDRDAARPRLEGLEGQPAGFGRAARGRQEADAEVQAAADPQPPRAEGPHARGQVGGDSAPGRGVGLQQGVGLAPRVCRLEAQPPPVDQRVPGLAAGELQADPCPAARNIDWIGVVAFGEGGDSPRRSVRRRCSGRGHKESHTTGRRRLTKRTGDDYPNPNILISN